MDVTINNKKIYSTKIMNSQTVAYTVTTLFSVFLLIFLKQLTRLYLGLSTEISVAVAFVIASVISFILERIFVFSRGISGNVKQILCLIFRIAVNFGFYKIDTFIFNDLLSMKSYSFTFLLAIIMCFVFNYSFDSLILFDVREKAENKHGGKLYRRFFNQRFVFLSMLTALIAISIIYIIFSVFPFGDSTVMRMDLYHQYGPLMSELYERITEGKSFIYSWNSAGGSSFIGNFFNYLSSPFSLLVLLFDKKNISNAISVIIMAKCIFSAGAFTYYLKKSQKSHSLVTATFGVLYAFCAYFLAYYWNIMWIDAMILFPLVMLGIENIINKRDARLYIISLFVLMFTNYYMGYMTCIFSVLYFFAYYGANKKWSDKAKNPIELKAKFVNSIYNNLFFNRAIYFACASMIVGILSAFFLVPVYMILTSSSATSDNFPTTFNSYFDIFDFLTSHLASLEPTIRSSGDDILPNVYCSILSIILVPLYLINSNIRLKEKISYIVLLLFLVFSFDNEVMNFIWHAFHFPNDLPYRYSFMYSFILLILAFKGLKNIKGIKYKDVMFTGLAWIVFICIAQKMINTKMDEITIYISIAFVIIWTGVLLLIKKQKMQKVVLGATVLSMAFCEVVAADSGSPVFSQKNSTYINNYDAYQDAIKYIDNNEEGFERTELADVNVLMSPCYYAYKGMNCFSSMASEKYSSLQYNLGMKSNRINSYSYHIQTPIYNMMFAINNIIYNESMSFRPTTTYFTEAYSSTDGATKVYKNDYSLPIAYCVNENIEKWNHEEGDPFEVQSDFFKKATGFDNVFSPCEYTKSNFENLTGEDVSENSTIFFTKNDDSDYGYIELTITPNTDGEVYLYVSSADVETIDINYDGESQTHSIDEPYIIDLGSHSVGDEIDISIDCSSASSSSSVEVYSYSVNNDVLKAGYEKLKESSLNVTDYNSTTINGNITVIENSYLYTSIPYDDGWKIFIDGQEVETFSIGDAMLSTTIKPGEHTVSLKYQPKGLLIGCSVSGVSFLSLAGYCIIKRKNDKKNCKN